MSGPRHAPRRGEDVSVVIPTAGRRPTDLVRAVRSVQRQDTPPARIIIVQSGASRVTIDDGAENTDACPIVMLSTVVPNGNSARMAGIRSATTPLIALLDDDDAWRPSHLAVALRGIDTVAAGGHPPEHFVHSAPVVVHAGGRAPFVAPRLPLGASETAAEYLFGHSALRFGRTLLHTSTLVFPRALALAVPWTEGLSRHQDWDWLVRIGRRFGPALVQASEPTCDVYWNDAEGSTSRDDRIAPGVAWAEQMLAEGFLTRQQFSRILLHVHCDLVAAGGDLRTWRQLVSLAVVRGSAPPLSLLSALLRAGRRHLATTRRSA